MMSITLAAAQSPPRVPPGAPTTGPAIGFITAGIDYTRPEVAARLARDGEGEIIAWRSLAQDRRPYLKDGPDDALVMLSPYLLVVAQLETTDIAAWSDAFTFLAQSPVRMVVVALPFMSADLRREVFARMAATTNLLFVVPGATGVTLARPANVIAVAALDVSPLRADAVDLVLGPPAATREAPLAIDAPPRTAIEAAVMLPSVLACLRVGQVRSPSDLKARLIAAAQTGPHGTAPLLSTCR
jgi:hypothetical protein